MSTITRELAKLFRKITNSEIDAEGNAHVVLSPADSLLINNARIALASIEAEAVAFRSKLKPPYAGSERWDYTDHRQPDAFELENCFIERLYTTPPAPVSVMDEAQSRELFEKNCMANIERNKWHPDLYAHLPAREQWAAWEACRAAMLQGADGALTDEDAKRVDELVMWIKRLAHSLRKANPDSKLQSDAMDYLSRKGLIGVEDILR